MATTFQKIVPHLWFHSQASEAVAFYVSVFPQSKITHASRMEGAPGEWVEVLNFELCGQPFMAIGAGSTFRFNESVSFIVNCDTQDEIDHYWQAMGQGGSEQACGWLKDRYGLSWQILPAVLSTMMQTSHPEQLKRVTNAFLKMTKFNLAALHEAYNG